MTTKPKQDSDRQGREAPQANLQAALEAIKAAERRLREAVTDDAENLDEEMFMAVYGLTDELESRPEDAPQEAFEATEAAAVLAQTAASVRAALDAVRRLDESTEKEA